jgi:Uma2 family endonuclease
VAAVSKSETDQADLRDGHPMTAALVIEVSGESLQKDRVAKGAAYAGAGIPEYVIVNLNEDCLEVHRDPDLGGRRYRSVSSLSGADRFQSATVSGFAFAVADLLSYGDCRDGGFRPRSLRYFSPPGALSFQ